MEFVGRMELLYTGTGKGWLRGEDPPQLRPSSIRRCAAARQTTRDRLSRMTATAKRLSTMTLKTEGKGGAAATSDSAERLKVFQDSYRFLVVLSQGTQRE